jgi:hypothetical protein
MNTELVSDFAGGSDDFVYDALDSLDKSDKPYVLMVMSNIDEGHLMFRLTPKSRQTILDMASNGELQNLFLEQIGGR